MAIPNNRLLSRLSASRELCVPSLPSIAFKHIAIKFSSTHFHSSYSLQLQLPPVNSKRRLRGMSLNVSRAMATGYVCFCLVAEKHELRNTHYFLSNLDGFIVIFLNLMASLCCVKGARSSSTNPYFHFTPTFLV